MIQPTPNDVLSGRGASFNRHPGNEKFRRMLDKQRVEYSNSVKTKKVAISKSIVEAVFSLEPPGRFLRRSNASGQWEELSKKEALNKVAQAMAYAVRDLVKVEREAHNQSHALPSQISIARSAAHAGAQGGNNRGSEHANRSHQDADNSTANPGLQLQRLLLHLQQSSNANLLSIQNPTHSTPVASLGGLAQLLNQSQLQQAYQRQQELHLLQQVQTQQLQSILSSSNQLASLQSGPLLPPNVILSLLPPSITQSNLLAGSLQPASLLGMQSQASDQGLLNLIRERQNQQSGAGAELPHQPSGVNQLQHRLDTLLQNQLLASLARNQWLTQQPSRQLDLLHQALSLPQPNNSQDNLTNNLLPPPLPRISSSSGQSSASPQEQQGREQHQKEGESGSE